MTGVNSMRIIAVSGGKGGIGKTTISVNLAISFAKTKKNVLLFDADLGLANIDVLLGLRPKKNINDVISGKCQLSDVCLEGPHGIRIIPGSSGIQKMSELSPTEAINLIQSFSSMTDNIDIMIVDLASGISNQVLTITHASQDIIIVICNDPSSFTDSYAVIKLLYQNYSRSRFGIIVNKVNNTQEGFTVFAKFQDIVSRFMNISMQYLGHLPYDDYVMLAARERVSVVDKYPESLASKKFFNLCTGINQWNNGNQPIGGIHFFFERLIQSKKSTKECM
jgi:flagellar biosynthesis protein FlhG